MVSTDNGGFAKRRDRSRERWRKVNRWMEQGSLEIRHTVKYLELGTVFEKAKWNLLIFTKRRRINALRDSLKLAHRRKAMAYIYHKKN